MGRQDAKRCIEHQLLEPWDSETAPPRITGLGALSAALKKWEKDKGLAINMRDQMRSEMQEAIARRKLLHGERKDSAKK